MNAGRSVWMIPEEFIRLQVADFRNVINVGGHIVYGSAHSRFADRLLRKQCFEGALKRLGQTL